MKIEIDVNRIVEKMDVNKIVEEKIVSDILEYSKLEDIVDNILENEDVKNLINQKVVNIIEEYLSSDQGKKYIIGELGDTITNSDILADDKITVLIAGFLRKSLMKVS